MDAVAAAPAAPPAATHTLTQRDLEGGGARLACPVAGCGREFRTSANVRVHARCHGAGALDGLPMPLPPPRREGAFHCCAPGCAYGADGGKTLANLKTALKHYAQRHADKTVACAHAGCGARFAKPYQLNRHVQNAHGGTLCKCGVNFASKHSLRLHVQAYAVNARDEHGPAPPAAPDAHEAPAAL